MSPTAVVRDGLVAGLIGVLASAAVYLPVDLWIGEPLRTPTLLGSALFYGVIADETAALGPELALQFVGLFVSGWVLVGVSGSLLISIVDTRPKLASIVFAGFAFAFLSFSYLAGASSVPGLAALHLWIGSVLAPAAAAGFLVLRHPKLASHIERVHLTETTRVEIERALALETAGCLAFEATVARLPGSPLERILDEKRGHVQVLSALADDLGLSPSEVAARPAWKATSLDEDLRAAIAHERELIDLYDRFLAVIPDLHIRDVFLRLRCHAQDSTVAHLEEALDRAR